MHLRQHVWIIAAAALLMTACSSSSKPKEAAPPTPGTSFSTSTITGLGTVLVDGSGKTVYLLTSGGKTNAPCDDANGCTKVWPDLPLPAGVTAATAGPGVQASLLGTMKLSDGETYPTYNGWLMYEFAQDTGPGQANGQGLHSFGGSWSAITPAGTPAGNPAGTPAGG
jgi:predicted lipoprotein with Yx(FWY)xxD motif